MTLNDEACGRKALSWTLTAIDVAINTCVWFYSPWYVSMLLTLLSAVVFALLDFALQAATSPETFASVGRGLGAAVGRAAGLFNRRVEG